MIDLGTRHPYPEYDHSSSLGTTSPGAIWLAASGWWSNSVRKEHIIIFHFVSFLLASWKTPVFVSLLYIRISSLNGIKFWCKDIEGRYSSMPVWKYICEMYTLSTITIRGGSSGRQLATSFLLGFYLVALDDSLSINKIFKVYKW